MNEADSQRLASALEQMGYEYSRKIDEADVIVLNTCVVRQSAEDKAYGRLSSIHPLKKNNPDLVVNLMGCLVGMKTNGVLKERFPWVDVFSPPSDPAPLIQYLRERAGKQLDMDETEKRYAWLDGGAQLPLQDRGKTISAYIPIVYGCSHACTFCIIPYRRGVERSRPPQEIVAETHSLVSQGVKEITLLGQIVDRYGKDQPEFPGLTGLLRRLHVVEDLERIRFLTSHPNWMTDELMGAVAELPGLMPHIEVPVQAGDDQVLANMRRGYTAGDYRCLVEKLRQRIPGVSIGTDVIVGFPGESEHQFQNTFDLLAELKLDVVHLARYSPRAGTVSARSMEDDVPDEEKWHRFRLLEELQKKIAAEIHARYLGSQVTVLFEEKVKTRWKGRTPNNELVFVESSEDLRGRLEQVNISWTGPWSMIGEVR